MDHENRVRCFCVGANRHRFRGLFRCRFDERGGLSHRFPGPCDRGHHPRAQTRLGALGASSGSPDLCLRGLFSVRLREFDGRDRPLPIMAPDSDSQTVKLVKPNPLHRTGLSIREDHGLADKLGLGLLELRENRGRANFRSWHGG
jgi:hypothetical protein